MAKKRGVSPLGNAPGSMEAQQMAAKSNLANLSKQLTAEIEKAGENVTAYLQNQFGLAAVSEGVVWRLASGETAIFNEVQMSYTQVRDNTFVTFDVNGRDQSLLTAESLQDLNSLEFQQFYPAVGREVDGRIDVLDGSRRRAWFLLQQGRIASFRMLVTRDDISVADAKALAKQLQTAKEHNLREIGLQCLAMKKANASLKQEDIAKQLGLSQAGVSKAMKAASIDERLITLFPVADALSHPDYALLGKVMKAFESSAERQAFVDKIGEEIVSIQSEYTVQDQKDLIITKLKSALKLAQEKSEAKAEVTTLKEFAAKGMFARKRINGRNFSYEFGRLSREVQDQLDAAIAAVLTQQKS